MALTHYPVEWTDRAIADSNSIYQYLHENWGKKAIQSFYRKLDTQINIISAFPEMFSQAQQGGYHRAVLTKQITISTPLMKKRFISSLYGIALKIPIV